MNIRVVLIESNKHIRNGLLLLLDGMPHISCLATFPSADSALAALPVLQPDVILTALDLPDAVNYADYLRRLSLYASPILLLSTIEHEEVLAHALQCGATGCLPKTVAPGVLANMIHHLAHNTTEISTQTAQILLRKLQQFPDKLPSIPTSELIVLKLLADGYSVHEAAEKLRISAESVRTRLFALLHFMRHLSLVMLPIVVRYSFPLW
jgi:DNA-binding NarL/FixJ family response regulator